MPSNYKYARATAASSLLSGVHDRQRREERGIEKIDLQRARRYGMKEVQANGRIKYTYGGIVFIYCPRMNKAVTSFKSPATSSKKSGTKVTTPILLEKHKFSSSTENKDKERTHADLSRLLVSSESMRAQWRSHSVLVVDMSGSMRSDDVNGARCRSDGVWMALARDYVKNQLKNGARDSKDLISIIVMKEEAETIMYAEPTTWVLYNKLVDMREWDKMRPSGPGYYLPAIGEAESLLTSNANAGCALSLLFFSDGRPSDPARDRPQIVEKIGELASKFGRRLSISCIGMADEAEDFSTLNDMVTEAQQYGAQAKFGKPSLDADSLSNIVSSLASSLTTSVTEMTELKTGKQRLVRMDVIREKINAPDTEGSWKKYNSSTQYISSYWSWNWKEGNRFVEVVDKRCGYCFDPNTVMCPKCKCYFVCGVCYYKDAEFRSHQSRYNNSSSECQQYLQNIRLGKIRHKDLPSYSIAIKDQMFNEGAERIVFKVRYLDSRGEFTGPIMVAKESRFVETQSRSKMEKMDYHRAFMRTQHIATDFAKKFNEALAQVQGLFDSSTQNYLSKLPRIEFIEPLVVELNDNGQEKNVLIEQYLEGDYTKFNNNMGYVEKEVKDLVGKMSNLGLGGGNVNRGFDDGLGAIVEGSEDESEEDSDTDEEQEQEEIFDTKESVPEDGTYSDLKDAYFPQAFSHFTYEKSKKMLMVVDLQGVFTINADGTKKVYKLTDPVIHKRRTNKNFSMRKWNFGRTDRNEKGMQAFFETHKCTDACRLLGLTEVDSGNVCRGYSAGKVNTKGHWE